MYSRPSSSTVTLTLRPETPLWYTGVTLRSSRGRSAPVLVSCCQFPNQSFLYFNPFFCGSIHQVPLLVPEFVVEKADRAEIRHVDVHPLGPDAAFLTTLPRLLLRPFYLVRVYRNYILLLLFSQGFLIKYIRTLESLDRRKVRFALFLFWMDGTSTWLKM